MEWAVSLLLLFSCSAVSDSWRPHRLQHARFLCPPLSLGASTNLCPIESVMPSNHLIPCRPLLLLPLNLSPGSFSMNGLFTSGSQNIGNFSISPSNEYSRLISFRIDWFDLLARESKGLSRSLLQHYNSKALSLLYGPTLISSITTGEKIALIFH